MAGTPNYPKDMATEWQGMKRKQKDAFNSANKRKALTRIGKPGQPLDVIEGPIRVLDENGDPRIEMGKLADGSYDLIANKPGESVSMTTLAFGMTADAVHGTFSPSTSGNYEDLGGPQRTVEIGSSGRALLIVTGSLSCDVGEWIELSAFGFQNGVNTYTPTITLAFGNKLTGTGLGGALVASISATDYAENLLPGEWTFKVYFKNVFATGTPQCTQANLVVMPF